MKPSLDKLSVSMLRPRAASPDYSFYEHHWDGPRRFHFPVWQPRQTTLFVVFDGESRHLFSTARILLYYSKASDARSNVWDIQPLGSVIHSFRDQHQSAPANVSTLPKLTIAFEVVICQSSASKLPLGILVLRSPASIQELRRDSISVLLERELPLTTETLSLTLSFAHSTLLCTTITPGSLEHPTMPTHPLTQIELITTRIVRVLPPASARPSVTNGCLPTELLIKTFEDTEFRVSWHDDLLSFAQVCRAWSCAMHVLHARLSFSEDDDRWYQSRHPLNVYTLAKALREKPILGQDFRQLTTNNLGESANEQDDTFELQPRQNAARFTAALITILRTTKKLRRLHLGQLDPGQADALFAVLLNLSDLETVSIGPPAERPIGRGGSSGGGFIQRRGPACVLSTAQLARCMARWPALASLHVQYLHPGMLSGRIWRVVLRPPGCTLTQLALSRARVSDRDLARLCASSARTLERVALDRVQGVTNAGLGAFLRAVAANVVCLTVREVALPPLRQRGHLVLVGGRERALDGVLDKMLRLRELRLGGDVASEFMLDRRSKMFVAYAASEVMQLPVVRLWLDNVPRLCGFAADEKWPGWCTPGKAPRT